MAKYKKNNFKLFLVMGASVLVVLGLVFVFTSFFSNVPQTKASNSLLPFYQYYSTDKTDHFYTNYTPLESTYSDYVLQKTQGYVAIDSTCITSLTPLYRYYSIDDTDHLYTINFNEYGNGANGYILENIAGYVSTTQIANTTPLYRYYSAINRDHFYTTTYGELSTQKYAYQGIEGYVFLSQKDICPPILNVTKNSAYQDQNIFPNNPDVKIGSFIIQNPSKTQTVHMTSLVIDTKIIGTTLSNFSALRTSNRTGNGSVPINFSGDPNGTTSTDTFTVDNRFGPGESMTLDIYAETGSATSGTITETLTANAEDKTNGNGIPTKGQTLTLIPVPLNVTKNSAYLDQNISPNKAKVKIGSFVIKNPALSGSVQLASLVIDTNITGTTLSNFSALVTSDTTGSGSIPITFSGTQSGTVSHDSFKVSDNLSAGQTMILDIFANTGSAISGTISETLTVTTTNSTSSSAKGQTMTLISGGVLSGVRIRATSTPSQYVAAGNGGASIGSIAGYNFTAQNDAIQMTEIGFKVVGSDATPTNTVSKICWSGVCALPINGFGRIAGTNFSLLVPNGGAGLDIGFSVSYPEVGTRGLLPSTTSKISLVYIKYTTGTQAKTIGSPEACSAFNVICTDTMPAVDAPTMTLVGSKPTLIVKNANVGGLTFGTQNKIGEITITADAKGNIKLNDLSFIVNSSGFTTNPTFTNAYITEGTSGSSPVTGSSCGQGVAADIHQTILCEFGDGVKATGTNYTNTESNTDYDGYVITAGQSQTFSLYATVSGAGDGAQISTYLSIGGLSWDDTSNNGGPGSTNLNGLLIYGFPLLSNYTIHR